MLMEGGEKRIEEKEKKKSSKKQDTLFKKIKYLFLPTVACWVNVSFVHHDSNLEQI